MARCKFMCFVSERGSTLYEFWRNKTNNEIKKINGNKRAIKKLNHDSPFSVKRFPLSS